MVTLPTTTLVSGQLLTSCISLLQCLHISQDQLLEMPLHFLWIQHVQLLQEKALLPIVARQTAHGSLPDFLSTSIPRPETTI